MMKTVLTIEQSAELIKRGISKDKASKRVTRQVADSHGKEIEKLRLKRWKDCVPCEKATMINLSVGLMRFEYKEIFTLADILSLLPKDLRIGHYHYYLLINTYVIKDCPMWFAKYITTTAITFHERWAEELIDALYELLITLLDNHVKLD